MGIDAEKLFYHAALETVLCSIPGWTNIVELIETVYPMAHGGKRLGNVGKRSGAGWAAAP